MKLNLKRPLAFFDLEATGINVGADRIVEIAILKVMPDGTEQLKTMRVNPEMPIPLASSLIHGIYDADIVDAPKFSAIAAEIAEFIADADLAGYNSNKFDIPLLLEEFLRAGIDFDMENRKTVDVQNIFHQMEQRTLKAAYKFYCGAELLNAHQAESDIRATYDVLKAQLERYQDQTFEDKEGRRSVPVVNDVEALHQFTNLHQPVDFAGRMVYNEAGEEVINFGKHKGKTVEAIFDMEPSYYAWMKQGDFPLYTKKKLDEIWKRWSKKKEAQKLNRQPGNKPAGNNKSVGNGGSGYADKAPGHRADKKKGRPVTDDMLEQLKIKFGR